MKNFFKILWATITLVLVFPFAPKRCIAIIRAKPVIFDVELRYSSHVDAVHDLLKKNNALDHLALKGKESIVKNKSNDKLVIWAKTAEDATVIKMKLSDRDVKDALEEFDPWRM